MANSSPPPAHGATWLGLSSLVWLVAALFILLLLPKIGAGTLWHHDELLTANRTREMLVRGDPFAVTVNFAPSVKKPPLQYWFCAGVLKHLPGNPEFALRLPTLLGGTACLLAAALLAQTWFPEADGSLAAWSAAALAGCGYLIHFSRVALLDTNAAWLLTLTLVAHRRAQRDARQWWLVSIFCVLGAWQKAPYGLAAWFVLLAISYFYGDTSPTSHLPPPTSHLLPPAAPSRWRFHLPAAFAAAIVGSLGWWMLQWTREDHSLLVLSGREQIGNFLRPHDGTDQGFRPWLYWEWLARDWAIPGLCAPLAAVAAIRAGKQRRAGAELGGLCVLFGGLIACLSYRAERYLILITPTLAVLTIHTLRRGSRLLPPTFRRWVLPVALASVGPAAAFQFLKPAPAQPDLLAAARALARTQRAGERLLVCTDADPEFEEAAFVLFYANLRRPLESITLPLVAALPGNAGPCRGICGRTQWPILQKAQPTFHSVATPGNWVLWTN